MLVYWTISWLVNHQTFTSNVGCSIMLRISFYQKNSSLRVWRTIKLELIIWWLALLRLYPLLTCTIKQLPSTTPTPAFCLLWVFLPLLGSSLQLHSTHWFSCVIASHFFLFSNYSFLIFEFLLDYSIVHFVILIYSRDTNFSLPHPSSMGFLVPLLSLSLMPSFSIFSPLLSSPYS